QQGRVGLASVDPASSSAWSTSRPAGPTKGLPATSSCPQTPCSTLLSGDSSAYRPRHAGGELEELSRPAHSLGSEPAAFDDDMAGVNPALRLLRAAESDGPGDPYAGPESLLGSYRRLADVFHDVLAEQSLDA